MPDNINIIDQFLLTFSPEVGGRSAGTLSQEMEGQLKKLSAGELPEAERIEIAQELLTNQSAINFLLAQVRGD
jgi:hypothetical protein